MCNPRKRTLQRQIQLSFHQGEVKPRSLVRAQVYLRSPNIVQSYSSLCIAIYCMQMMLLHNVKQHNVDVT